MIRRVRLALVCCIVGFVIGFSDYIVRGAVWQMQLHYRRPISLLDRVAYITYYSYVSLHFVVPLAILFLVLFFALSRPIFQHWFVSMPVAVVLGAAIPVILLYGFSYRGYPEMARLYLYGFLPRCILASLSMFACGTWLSRRHQSSNPAMQPTAGPRTA